MNAPDVKKIVEEWLEGEGYEGLYNEAGCGCQLSELALCGEMTQNCEAAYLFDCSRCAKRPSCDIADEEQPYLMSTDKNFCEPDYTVAAPAAAFAADGAALPACAPLTVGEAVFGVDCANAPDWYAQGGIGEAPEDALKIEPGEVIMPIADMAEVIAKAIADTAPKPKPAALAMPLPAKEVCQNTAKTEPASRVLKEDRTAEYIRFLEYGA